jgi:hypothetical protein
MVSLLQTEQAPGGNIPLARADGGTLLVQAGGPLSNVSLAHIQTPNTETQFLASEAPGPGGALLAVLDITPNVAGRLRVTVTVALDSSAPDTPEVALVFIDNLTAVTGGTPIAPGITAGPTSTTPPASGGVSMFEAASPTFTFGANTVAFVTLASMPLQVTPGHRVGIAVFLASPASATFTAISAAMTVDEV